MRDFVVLEHDKGGASRAGISRASRLVWAQSAEGGSSSCTVCCAVRVDVHIFHLIAQNRVSQELRSHVERGQMAVASAAPTHGGKDRACGGSMCVRAP